MIINEMQWRPLILAPNISGSFMDLIDFDSELPYVVSIVQLSYKLFKPNDNDGQYKLNSTEAKTK